MKKSVINIPVFVICLDREIDRRKRIKDHLDSLGVLFSFINAVDGQQLNETDLKERYSETLAIKSKGRPLAKSEVGCYLSHTSIWDNMVQNNIQKALIVESDAVFSKETIEAINQVDKTPHHWDLVMLHYNFCFPAFKGRLVLTEKLKLVRFSNKVSCTTAYLLTFEGAQKLLSKAYPIKLPVDCYMTGGYVDKNINLFGVYPRVVSLTDDALDTSSIRPELFSLFETHGIKRRTSQEVKLLKKVEQQCRRFVKKIFPPKWL